MPAGYRLDLHPPATVLKLLIRLKQETQHFCLTLGPANHETGRSCLYSGQLEHDSQEVQPRPATPCVFPKMLPTVPGWAGLEADMLL